MYFGRQTVRTYDPIDTNRAIYSGSTVGREVGEEMKKYQAKIADQDAQAQAEHRRLMADSAAQQQHERGMLEAEQRRRMYDSETARQSQQQKYSLLGGLLGGGAQGMGGGTFRRFGDRPSSERRRV